MYETEWYNSGDIVPDQVTPACDAIPLNSVVNGSVGTSNEYATGDHQHPLQVSTVLPAKDTANDTGSGTAGASNVYSSATYQHLLYIDPTTANVPIVNATAAANATKFNKTGGMATEILCANGNTTSDFVIEATTLTITGTKIFNNYITAAGYKIANGTNQLMLMADGSTKPFTFTDQEFYITGSIQYFKLQMFGAYTTPTDVSVEFTCKCRIWFGLIQFNQIYTSDGIGTYQYKLQFNMSYGMDVCNIIYFGTGANRYGELQARVLMWSNQLIFQQINQDMEIESLMDVLNNEMQPQLPSGASSSTALFANQFNSAVNISNNLNDNRAGLRIARQANGAGIYLRTKLATDGGTTAGQWNIITTPENSTQNPLGFTICLGPDATSNNRGLRISADGNTLTFNGRTL
ncbi:MAG: hypothetical protein EZS28_004074 [Streblomastix strix]|uniref:Uncharacterized protein n=1 Tax=Streblomastix strix TaxID=222440 RepID=A0A5J4WZS9_9EUKA|nr:MAG: hypothetical protein EZS28_004074 [Streblomastix strix]